jgi:hypothetical protein
LKKRNKKLLVLRAVASHCHSPQKTDVFWLLFFKKERLGLSLDRLERFLLLNGA